MRVHCISKAISHEINFEDNKALFSGKIGRKPPPEHGWRY